MNEQHPITPPPELVREWRDEAYGNGVLALNEYVATRAAQWGADQELEACCKWLLGSAPWTVGPGERIEWVETLAMCRRPKPPSLKEQAWKLLECYGTSGVKLTADQCNTIRRALEELPND